jgi:hypothetical protein
VEPIEAEVDGRRVVARELRRDDLEALVAYWHESPVEYLRSLGVDPAKLGTPGETRARLGAGLEPGSEALTVVAEMEGELIAYSNLARCGEATACAHLHTLRDDPVARHSVYELFSRVALAALAELGVSKLRFEASVGNRGINRYLQSFGLQPRRLHLDSPHGMALPGEFNVYELTLAEVPG